MSKNTAKREVLNLVAFKNMSLKEPLSYQELENKILEAIKKGASYNTICETFNIKSTVIAYIKEERGIFTKGMFKGLNSAQIAAYKLHIKDSEYRNMAPLPVDEWLEEQEDTDDDQAEQQPSPDVNVKIAGPVSLHGSDVYDLVHNNFRVFNALNTMLNEMHTGSKGALSITFEGTLVKGFNIQND